MSKVVYFDMDGVLADFIGGFCDYFSEYTNSDYEVSASKWAFYEDLGLTHAEFEGWLETLPITFWAGLGDDIHFEQFKSDIRELQMKGYDVRILTHAVTHNAIQGKKRWLEIRGLGDLQFHTVRKSKDKAAFAKLHAKSILIDDNPSNVFEYIEAGGEAMLVNRTWNNGSYAADTMDCWLTDGHSVVQWVGIALGQVYEPEPILDLQMVKDAFEIDSYGFYASEGDTTFELPNEVHNAYDDVTPPPAGEMPSGWQSMHTVKPKLDYSAMDDKQYRKNTPLCSGCLWYFPDALELVAQNSMVGHVQHNCADDPMYWDRSKSADEPDALVRHLKDHHKNPIDDDGTLHLSKVAWRALAMLQKYLEQNPNWRSQNVK